MADTIVQVTPNVTNVVVKVGQSGPKFSPLLVKGDLFIYSTLDDRLPVGVDDYI